MSTSIYSIGFSEMWDGGDIWKILSLISFIFAFTIGLLNLFDLDIEKSRNILFLGVLFLYFFAYWGFFLHDVPSQFILSR